MAQKYSLLPNDEYVQANEDQLVYWNSKLAKDTAYYKLQE